MLTLKAGVIFPWVGTNASIPAGWQRVTALDSKFPKGSAVSTNPNATGGTSTHTHTSPAHTHTLVSHTHTISFGTGSGGGADTGDSTQQSIHVAHTHSNATSGAVSSASIQSVAVTYSAVSNNPPYYGVIFITPTSYAPYLPNLAVYLYGGSDSRDGHYICDGNNSTPNLTDKYLRGAGTGANAGGTGGGTTNTHTIAHTHTHTHGHASANSGAGSGETENHQAGSNVAVLNHVHAIVLGAYAGTSSSNSSIGSQAEIVEPAYTKLLAVQNRTGAGAIRSGMIAMWLGTLANIPSNFELCDGTNGTPDMRSRHLKITSTVGDIGNTGGANTHVHANESHDHDNISHQHATPISVNHSAVLTAGATSPTVAKPVATSATSHTVANTSATMDFNTANTSAESSNNEPEYRTVAFIRLIRVARGGGAFFL
jgi:hypothetical protein